MNPMFTQRTLKGLFSIILFSFFTLPGLSLAKEQLKSDIVPLADVIKDITRTDPSILEAMERYRSVLAEREIAASEFRPTVGTIVSVGPERTDGVPTDDKTEDLFSTSATLFARQNLYNGGRSTAFVAETDARILASAYEVLNAANNVYLDCSEAYINVVKSIDMLKIAKENALTQERIMRQVREKAEAGFHLISDLYNSESRLSLAKATYISRQQDLHQALVYFHRQFGRLLRPEQFILPESTYQPPTTLPEAVDLAFQRHPALKVARYNIETRQHTYDKAAAADYPTLDFELRGQYRDDIGGEKGDTTQSGAYLTLSYNFYDGGFRDGEKARDKQAVRKENQRSYIERRNVNESVRLAWNIIESEDYKTQYLVEHVDMSSKTLEAFKEEYYVGRRSLLDILNMENEYTDAKLSMSESYFSRLIALHRIMQSTGVLLEEYDVGLRQVLNLPPVESDDLIVYRDLDQNRDEDLIIDTSDQCDNSAIGADIKPAGCLEENVNNAGYPYNRNTKVSPYIAPQDFQLQPE